MNTGTQLQQMHKGVRVLDLSQYIPGPFASMRMTELGAETIKIEPPGGDPMRQLGMQDDIASPVYNYLNRGKRIVEINLKTTAGMGKLFELIAQADVLIEGFRPGTLERLGLADSKLTEMNPELIVCHLSGYGQTGPYANKAGHDLGYAALAGLYTEQYRSVSLQPVYPPVADHAGALEALQMINAALYQRSNTGKGCVLDISLYGAVSQWQYMFAAESLGKQLSGKLAYYNIYQTSDGYNITLAALETKFWKAFCAAAGRPDWVSRHADPMPQLELTEELVTLFASETRKSWQHKLANIDCCFEPVVSQAELLESFNQRIRGELSNCASPEYHQLDTIHWN